MSFLPLWPSLQPRETDPLWFNADRSIDDETEVQALEAENKTWKDELRMEGYDYIPIGKTSTNSRGSEEEEEDEEEEEEGEGEEEDDSDTHEDDDEDLDEIHMEVSYSHQLQRTSPTGGTPSDAMSIRMVGAHAPRYT